MNRACLHRLLVALLILCAASPAASAGVITIDFEGLSDGTFVTTQYSGLTVSNAVILTSGISLNELDFPPRSGANVASDSSGPFSVTFSTPVLDFLGYFTYVTPLTVRAFDSSNQLLASATSLFTTNTVSGGDTGSSPNEAIEIASLTGFSKIVITGDPAGSSFTLDDLTYTSGAISSVPEPSSLLLAGFGALLLAAKANRRR